MIRDVATKMVKVVVCDCCGSDKETARYRVGFPGGKTRTFDLCAVCASTIPLAELKELLAKVGTTGPKYRQQPVLSQAEAEKRVRKTATTKKTTARKRSPSKE